ncbi:Eukaryotic aspartyl protease family protein [Abeliophyllum distichum]|uniref:Eukaryotic aspartyl protease family protein n=1 Tax=Abeliophyllum distichum TaxID=126358 RepID=A0ABD1REZ6_9LAMI
MASFLYTIFLFLSLFICSSVYAANVPSNGLVLPVRKDAKTSQYYATLQMGSNRVTVNAVIDLGSQFLWFACDSYTSSTYKPIPCGSKKCEVAKGNGCMGCNLPARPGCTNDTCGSSPYSPFENLLFAQGFAEDTLYSKNNVKVPEFPFSCFPAENLGGFASLATGMLGLARTEIALHKQVANKFKLPHKFALCIPSDKGVGKIFIGGGKYSTKSLVSTPLIINPVSTYPIYTEGDPSDEYFIDVQSISVNGRHLAIKTSYFSIDEEGVGGTKISTINNFTVLHNSIYKPLNRAFVKAASDMKIKSVAAVAPFRACFSAESITRSGTGPFVPTIDIVLPGKDVYWRIYGANSMVKVNNNVLCLAFVDGGKKPRTSIVIGGHQLEDNLLEFDLVSSKLSFTSSLLLQNSSCSRV